MTKPGYKNCPFCFEEIRTEALKCRFCQSMLTDMQPGQVVRDAQKIPDFPGLSPPVEELFRDLEHRSDSRRSSATAQLLEIAEKLPLDEQKILCRYLFDKCIATKTGQKNNYLELLTTVAPRFADDAATRENIFSLADQLLSDNFENYAFETRNLLVCFGRCAPESFLDQLAEKIRHAGQIKIKAELLLALTSLRNADERDVSDLVACLSEPENIPKLKKRLFEDSERSLPLVLTLFEKSNEEIRLELLPLLDEYCRFHQPPPDLSLRLAEILLDQFSTGSALMKNALIEARLWSSVDFPAEVKIQLAKILLNCFRFMTNPYQIREISYQMLKIGELAIPLLLDFLQERRGLEISAPALEIIGEIVIRASNAKHSDNCIRAIHFVRGEISADREPRGTLVETLGKLCRSRLIPADLLEDNARFLLRPLTLENPDRYLIKALSELAENPALSAASRRVVLDLFLLLFNRLTPLDVVCETDTPLGIIYQADDRILFEEYLVPSLLTGLGHLYQRYAGDTLTANLIISAVMEKWENLKSLREVWSPANFSALALLIGDIARVPQTPAAARTTLLSKLMDDILLGGINEMPMVEKLPAICDLPHTNEFFSDLFPRIIDILIESVSDSERELWEKRITASILLELNSRENLFTELTTLNSKREKIRATLTSLPEQEFPNIATRLRQG